MTDPTLAELRAEFAVAEAAKEASYRLVDGMMTYDETLVDRCVTLAHAIRKLEGASTNLHNVVARQKAKARAPANPAKARSPFGAPGIIPVTANVSPDLHRRFQALCRKRMMTMAARVRQLIEADLEASE